MSACKLSTGCELQLFAQQAIICHDLVNMLARKGLAPKFAAGALGIVSGLGLRIDLRKRI